MTILVADISNWNPKVNLHYLKNSGVEAVYHKATEGPGYTDPYFAARLKEAHTIGLPFGGYHFARPENNPMVEADHFCRVIGRTTTLRPVLDLEVTPRGHLYPGSASLESWARTFNRSCHYRLGHWPIFYSYSAFISAMRIRGGPIGGGLWLASYSRNDGKDHPFFIPSPWKHYVLHQFTSVGKIGGVVGNVDLSHGPDLQLIHS